MSDTIESIAQLTAIKVIKRRDPTDFDPGDVDREPPDSARHLAGDMTDEEWSIFSEVYRETIERALSGEVDSDDDGSFFDGIDEEVFDG